MIYLCVAVGLIAVLALSAIMTMANAVKQTEELTKKTNELEKMCISLAQTVAEQMETTKKHDEIIEHMDEHVVQMFNEAYNNAAKELSDGINQVLNFTPYGVK